MAKIGIDARLIDESGVGRYIRNILYDFDKRELRDDLVVYLTENNFKSHSFRNSKIEKRVANVRWHTLKEQWAFKEILEKDNLDLVHFPYFSYPIFYKRRFVITIHDLIIDHYPTGIASSLPYPLYWLKHYGYKKVLKSAIKNSKKIIVPSVATKEELIALYHANESKIEVVYEGFDPKISKGKDKKELVSKEYILYVGNAYPHKNLKNLLKAFSTIRKKSKVDLVLIGRDDFFYKRLDKNIEGLKILHGVDDKTLFEYYTNARLFVMPSLMEGFGLPILEAMNLSCPVIASNTKALKEIGGDGCIYFDPNNAQDMAEKIESVLLGRVDTKKLIDEAKKQTGKFSWKKCADETLRIYESCNSV